MGTVSTSYRDDGNAAMKLLCNEKHKMFPPVPTLALRTLKADVVVGLSSGLAEETAAKDSDWMTSGRYGLIQLFNPLSS